MTDEKPTLEECKDVFLRAWERSRGPHAKACFWNKDEQAGLAAVRDLCLASCSPSYDLIEAADAMRDHLAGIYAKGLVSFGREAALPICQTYDTERARHVKDAPAPCSVCKGSGLVKLSHDPSVIGVATCSACNRFGFFKKSLYCLSCSAWISSRNPVHECTEAKLEIRNRN